MSGKIDITNYEAWLLDYFEGNLSKEQVSELKAFVLTHPELEIDLDDNELLMLDKEDYSFEGKEDLFKPVMISEEALFNYLEGNLSEQEKISVDTELSKNKNLAADLDLFKKTILIPEPELFGEKANLLKTEDEFILANRVIAYLENELTAEEKTSFENELQTNTLLSSELTAYSNTIIKADYSVVFPDKNTLKKEAKVLSLFSYRNMSAAAAVLLLTGITALTFNYYSTSFLEKGSALSSVQKNNFEFRSEIDPSGKPGTLLAQNSDSKKSVHTNSQYESTVKVIKCLIDTNAIKPETTPFENVAVQPAKNSTDTIAIAKNIPAASHTDAMIKYTNENVLALADDEEEVKTEKNGFWKRAVKLAQQVNGLGVKAVKGDEKNGEEYSLSFNAFSIEKK